MKLFVIALIFSLPTWAAEPVLELTMAGESWVLKRTVPPRYPGRAIRTDTTGHVRLYHTIDKKGRVRDIEIIESVPPGIFDKATVRALKQFRYKPTASNRDRIPVRVEFRMNFDLRALARERQQGSTVVHYD